LHGFCETKGRRAYVPQKPFLLNGTVRQNIIFGLPLDEERYNSALEMSALPDDLKTLTDGDATLVGESGVRTSGHSKIAQS
jgi:ABC-type multidrug transport system fused ATPase/permease subunit